MQISPKPAAQARNDFEILMHSSKEEQINFTSPFYSVYMLQVQEISRTNFKISLPGKITLI